MNIQAEKKWIIQELQKVKDENLILVFKNLLNYADKKRESLKPMSMLEYHNMLAESEEDYKAGRTVAHEDVVKYFKKKK